VRDYGAKGNATQLDTKALQSAIDAVSAKGGGTVVVPPGRYVTGTLFLRSGVILHLTQGSAIVGSEDLSQYPATVSKVRSYTNIYSDKSLIYAEDVQRVGIEGDGILAGRGASFKGPYKVRLYTIRMINCRDVSIRDIQIVDSPMWVQHYWAISNTRRNEPCA
jgi:polygalacturonase